MPLLSIIIPVYNAEKYLGACIDSVLKQEFTDFELILVNDGSSDRSLEICQSYMQKDKRVNVFNQINQGQSGARNRGLSEATGKYVGFCDNDDVIQPNMYNVLVNNILSMDADVSACSYKTMDSRGNISHNLHTDTIRCFTHKEGMREYLSREMMDIYVWTKIYNKNFLDGHNIRFECGRSDEDFLFNHEVFLYANKTVFIAESLYTYYVRDMSECRIFYKKNLKRYLHNTLYRTYRVETITRERYPEYLNLAQRQTILYNIIMIGRIIQEVYTQSEPYYSYIMRYIRNNRSQVIKERTHWGMSLLGVILMVYLPSRLYYTYRRLKFKISK